MVGPFMQTLIWDFRDIIKEACQQIYSLVSRIDEHI
jgi:hypothetical protein